MPPQPSAAPTMKDVAREAGVSKALVSIVFRGAPGASDATRARVIEAARRLGYRPNRSASLLARTRTHQLGMVLDLRNGFHVEVAEAALTAASDLGYHLLLSPLPADRDEVVALTTALEFRCEAVLIVGNARSEKELAHHAVDVPLVYVGRQDDSDVYDVVRMADDVGMELVVDHLVALGQRHIAHIDGGEGDIAAARRAGFERAVRRHRIKSRCLVAPGGQTEDAGRGAARSLLARSTPPTAVAAFNDRSAVGVLEVLHESGLRVPADMAVTGYDDSPIARLYAVDLTSVQQDPQELGLRAVRAAATRLDHGPGAPRCETLAPVLRIRGTSGPPNERTS
ncbi:MAG: LacI family DNA-binding transcriptional regulator [Mobilicoccus sp.]|nr:LacI family DNA-binding transcriptional regulator [Mobilicoccus sp.]